MEWNLRLADAARIELRAGRTEELVVGRWDLRVVVKGSGWIVGPWMERVQHGAGSRILRGWVTRRAEARIYGDAPFLK